MTMAMYLADLMNNLDDTAEKSKDKKVYEEGLNNYKRIKLNITFTTPRGLEEVPKYLTEHGNKVYNKYFKSLIEAEIKKQGG